MATEIVPGAEDVLSSVQRAADPSLPLEERFDPGFVDHDPADGQPAGGGGLAWYWETFSHSFSDMNVEVLEIIVTPDHVTTVADLSATHTGDWLGHAPTGKRFTVRNVQVMAVQDGRPIGRWGSTDQLGMLQQLGLL